MNKENLTKISLNEQKKIANSILFDIKDYCDKEGIIYYIAFGTALGAVRHKGFIPWDDDIDIIMPRKDYEKFKLGYNLRNTQYKLICNDLEDGFWAPLPKVIDTTTLLVETLVRDPYLIGVYVDIFVYDNVPDNKLIRTIYFWKMKFILKCWSFIRHKRNYCKYSPLNMIYNWAINNINPSILIKCLDKMAQEYNHEVTSYWGCNEYCTFKYLYSKEWFGKGTNVIFEGIEYRTVKDWDAFLKCVYGDYMQLPPVEQRKTAHYAEVYYKAK